MKKIINSILKLTLIVLLCGNMGCALAAGAAIASGVGALASGFGVGKGYDSDAGGIKVKDQAESQKMVEQMREERKREYEASQASSSVKSAEP
ncbi:MAG: hypothetical protein C0402_05200 [Thermodesulfovibrio sp.]|nr:hypothetical protein [Thermodesulfovibrio sp.]